ncbi:MAG: chemotaxis protein CheW [Treponema sp.]
MSDYLDPNNEELLKDFFSEAEQQVETLESNVLVIEHDPTNHEAVDEIFRAAHTLKGGSATVEMNELSSFTHKVEDVLDEIRSDRLSVDEKVVDILLSSIDVIKAMLEARANGSVYEENIDDLVSRLKEYIPEKGAKGAKSKPSAPKAAKPAPAAPAKKSSSGPSPFNYPAISESDYMELKSACEGNQKLWLVSVKFDENNPMNSVGGIQVFAALKALGSVLKTIPDFDALYEDQFYEFVYYYIASDADAGKIEDVAFLSDVTLVTDAKIVDGASEGGTGMEESEPVSAAEPEPSTKTVTQASEPAAKAAPEKAEEHKASPQADAKKDAGSVHAVQQGSVLRVDSRRIDLLMNLVSETVITKASFNQLAATLGEELLRFQTAESTLKSSIHQLFEQFPSYLEQLQEGKSVKDVRASILGEFGGLENIFDTDDSELKSITSKLRSSTQNLGRIASELQEGVMKIRMVPINQIFSRFPRVVRDLQRDLNKKVELMIEGEDTELDKSVVEDLLDPIMHCVRNSVDHGIETPAERKASGKSESGTVILKASNEGNLIVIEIADDGAGIDTDRVKQKAIERGLVHPDKQLTEAEAQQLIFLPGFSTADKITNVSGRGVGLDVVKTMIDKLNGTVTVSSQKGQGTTFSIRLPLTLAIIQGLLVRVGKEIYSIPIVSVIESQRILQKDIKTIDSYEVLNVRNEVISVLRLSRLFGIQESHEDEYCNIVIVGSKDKKVGIMVDSLVGEEDVVIKPLRDQFTNSPGIAGASILGDGSVSLIIDVSQLLDLSVKQDIDAQRMIDRPAI